jgi:phosphoglycolate phosphatase
VTVPPTIVFDLDGTLVDTAPDLVRTLNVILEGEHMAPVAYGAAVETVGAGARAMIDAAFASAGRAPTDAELDRLFEAFIAHYTAHIADHSRPFDGVEAALDRFAEAGWTLAVCTNKLEKMSRQLLGELGMTERFAAIAGPDTFGYRKPDPRHLTETIRVAGGSPDKAVMVGDSRFDIDVAKAAGIPVVAVNFGYTPVPVEELGPDRIIGHYDALWDAVASLSLASP